MIYIRTYYIRVRVRIYIYIYTFTQLCNLFSQDACIMDLFIYILLFLSHCYYAYHLLLSVRAYMVMATKSRIYVVLKWRCTCYILKRKLRSSKIWLVISLLRSPPPKNIFQELIKYKIINKKKTTQLPSK